MCDDDLCEDCDLCGCCEDGECCGCDCCGKYTCFFSTTVFLGLLLLVILLPLSLNKIDFDEVGISYDTVSRELGTEVKREGLYDLGPSGKFLKWKRTQRSIGLNNVPLLTKDAIQITLDLQVLFSIQTPYLRELIDDWYDQAGYESFVHALCQATVRDVASNYDARSFYIERAQIQLSITDWIQWRFGNLTVRANIESVQVSDIRLPSSVQTALLATTTAKQDIKNAESERATLVQAAEIREALAVQNAEITLSEAQRDVNVINQAAAQERLAETEKLRQRTDAFGNISLILGRGGDFFVNSYLRYLVMRQNGANTVVGLN